MYAVLIRLYPRNPDEEGPLTLQGPYTTAEEAAEYIAQARRQNLPFKEKRVVSIQELPEFSGLRNLDESDA
jgi:hypothetical protein